MYRNIVIPVNVFSRDDREQAFCHAQFFANVSSGHVHLLGLYTGVCKDTGAGICF